MPKNPVVSGRETVKILQKLGFEIVSQRGSHIKLAKGSKKVIVPNHKQIKKGTLRNGILKPIGLEIEEFAKLLKEKKYKNK